MKSTLSTIAFAGGLFVVGSLIEPGCAKPPTTQQVGAVTDAACTILDAYAASPEEEALCATADDIAAIVTHIRAGRADAGPPVGLVRRGEKCQIVGDVCATEAELATAIKARKVAKR